MLSVGWRIDPVAAAAAAAAVAVVVVAASTIEYAICRSAVIQKDAVLLLPLPLLLLLLLILTATVVVALPCYRSWCMCLSIHIARSPTLLLETKARCSISGVTQCLGTGL